MNIDKFIEIVKSNNGFEFSIGYKDWVDHYIGGKDNKFWYYIDYNGKKSEYYIGTYENGVWIDKFYTSKNNKIITSKSVESGITINKIIERAFYYQDKISNRKPILVEKEEGNYLHYSFNFGESACEISEKYGVTTFFSNINNEDEGYHLRNIYIGSDVNIPNEK